MSKETDDFTVCSDNWEKIQQVCDLQNQVEHIRLWFAADQEPNEELLEGIDAVIGSAAHLYRQLIDLQIKLLTIL